MTTMAAAESKSWMTPAHEATLAKAAKNLRIRHPASPFTFVQTSSRSGGWPPASKWPSRRPAVAAPHKRRRLSSNRLDVGECHFADRPHLEVLDSVDVADRPMN